MLLAVFALRVAAACATTTSGLIASRLVASQCLEVFDALFSNLVPQSESVNGGAINVVGYNFFLSSTTFFECSTSPSGSLGGSGGAFYSYAAPLTLQVDRCCAVQCSSLCGSFATITIDYHDRYVNWTTVVGCGTASSTDAALVCPIPSQRFAHPMHLNMTGCLAAAESPSAIAFRCDASGGGPVLSFWTLSNCQGQCVFGHIRSNTLPVADSIFYQNTPAVAVIIGDTAGCELDRCVFYLNGVTPLSVTGNPRFTLTACKFDVPPNSDALTVDNGYETGTPEATSLVCQFTTEACGVAVGNFKCVTDPFSVSSYFLVSAVFIPSRNLFDSEPFAPSFTLSPTAQLSDSSLFLVSTAFTASDEISDSAAFQSSADFIDSQNLPDSAKFVASSVLTMTDKLSRSMSFVDTDILSDSTKFMPSTALTNSDPIPDSSPIRPSSPLIATPQLQYSSVLTDSRKFTATRDFTESTDLSDSLALARTEDFARTPEKQAVLVPTGEFNHSVTFSGSARGFSATRIFSFSVAFSNNGDPNRSKPGDSSIIYIAIGIAAALVVVAIVVFFVWRARVKANEGDDEEEDVPELATEMTVAGAASFQTKMDTVFENPVYDEPAERNGESDEFSNQDLDETLLKIS
jgi:hypothetical protein